MRRATLALSVLGRTGYLIYVILGDQPKRRCQRLGETAGLFETTVKHFKD